MQTLRSTLMLAVIAALSLSGCYKPDEEKYELGHEKNPVVMALVPSSEVTKIMESAEELIPMLEEKTGLHFDSHRAPSYVGVVESMSIGDVHFAWLPPMAYVFAHDRNGDTVGLKVVRHGSATYQGQIVVMADSGIETLEDLRGKRISFVDAASASGHLYPRSLLLDNNLDPDTEFTEVKFAGGHDASIIALLNDNVDAACCYVDARSNVVKQGFDDVMETTKVLAVTDDIPADNVTFYSGLDEEIREKIVTALVELAEDEKGSEALYNMYEIEGLIPASDGDYDPLRKVARVLGLDIKQEVENL